jgi:beta-lactamase regulating signal transducer with metallopeptidase domain
MKNIIAALSKILVIGWFVMAIVLYVRALFNPKYALLTWFITLICILIYFFAPPQACTICLDGGYIDGK